MIILNHEQFILAFMAACSTLCAAVTAMLNSWRALQQSRMNSAAIAQVHECLDAHHERVMAVMTQKENSHD